MNPLLLAAAAGGAYYLYDQRKKKQQAKPSGGPAGYAPPKPPPVAVGASEADKIKRRSGVRVGAVSPDEERLCEILGVNFLTPFDDPRFQGAYVFKTSEDVYTEIPAPIVSAEEFDALAGLLNAEFPGWEADWLRPGVIVFFPEFPTPR